VRLLTELLFHDTKFRVNVSKIAAAACGTTFYSKIICFYIFIYWLILSNALALWNFMSRFSSLIHHSPTMKRTAMLSLTVLLVMLLKPTNLTAYCTFQREPKHHQQTYTASIVTTTVVCSSSMRCIDTSNDNNETTVERIRKTMMISKQGYARKDSRNEQDQVFLTLTFKYLDFVPSENFTPTWSYQSNKSSIRTFRSSLSNGSIVDFFV
jgi:hypothetical protein